MTKPLIQDTCNWQMLPINTDNYVPAQPDGWPVGGHALVEGTPLDREIWGDGVLRIETGLESIPTLPVKIRQTGRKLHDTFVFGTYKVRVQFEHLHDGEPSEFQGGWLYLFSNLDK